MLKSVHRNRAGVDALALDPQDDSKVYIAVGEYTNRFVLLNSLTSTRHASC